MQARRVLHQQMTPAYRQASGTQKQAVPEEFVTATEYAHKCAQWLLNHAEQVFISLTALRLRYGPDVKEAFVLTWKTLNRICSKRLIPFLPEMLDLLEVDMSIHLSKQHRALLLSMSAATADHLLQAIAIPTLMAFGHQSRSFAQTADPDPHLCSVGRGYTGLPGGGPDCPFTSYVM